MDKNVKMINWKHNLGKCCRMIENQDKGSYMLWEAQVGVTLGDVWTDMNIALQGLVPIPKHNLWQTWCHCE